MYGLLSTNPQKEVSISNSDIDLAEPIIDLNPIQHDWLLRLNKPRNCLKHTSACQEQAPLGGLGGLKWGRRLSPDSDRRLRAPTKSRDKKERNANIVFDQRRGEDVLIRNPRAVARSKHDAWRRFRSVRCQEPLRCPVTVTTAIRIASRRVFVLKTRYLFHQRGGDVLTASALGPFRSKCTLRNQLCEPEQTVV